MKGWMDDNKNSVFPPIDEYPVEIIGSMERAGYQYPIIKEYLIKKIKGWSAIEFFHKIGAEKVALYAATELGDIIIQDLEMQKTKLEVLVLCDKNYRKYPKGIRGVPVIGIDEIVDWYKAEKLDKIVVCSVFYSNEIIRDLLKKRIAAEDIITAADIILG